MNHGDSEGQLDRESLELALGAAGIAEFDCDLVADRFFVSDRLSAIIGVPPGVYPALGARVMEANIHPADMEAFRAGQADRLLQDAYEFHVRYIRPDTGRTIWVRTAGVTIHNAQGEVTRVAGIVQDVTAAKLAESERQSMLAELDHRVKNVLATVQALAQQTAKRSSSVEAFLAHFGGRLRAMASANELLTAARWRGAAIDHLVAAELGALAPGQTSWDGPELFLTPRVVNALALALHEMASNAVKFGALSNESGRVEVRWSSLPDGGFELRWTESGGPPVTAPRHTGFGVTLLAQVTARELYGETFTDYTPGGFKARLTAGPAALVRRPDIVPEGPLPVPPEAEVAAVAEGGRTDSLRGARVLIVEDAVLLALELETGLAGAGAQVVGPAYELQEALALINLPIDAAVLDANLNGHSVSPVAKALAARGVPFVFATGYGDGGAPAEFGAPVIRKPYDVTQVAAAVAGLLARA